MRPRNDCFEASLWVVTTDRSWPLWKAFHNGHNQPDGVAPQFSGEPTFEFVADCCVAKCPASRFGSYVAFAFGSSAGGKDPYVDPGSTALVDPLEPSGQEERTFAEFH